MGLLGPTPRPQARQQQTNGSHAYYSTDHTTPMTPAQLEVAFNTMQLRPLENSWYMDTGSTSHLTNDSGNFSHKFSSTNPHPIIVGNGTYIPSLGQGSTTLSFPNQSYSLQNVYHVPQIIKNLVSVRKLCHHNLVSVEFDSLGFFCEGSYHKEGLNEA